MKRHFILLATCLFFLIGCGGYTDGDLINEHRDGYNEGYRDGEKAGYDWGYEEGANEWGADGYAQGLLDGSERTITQLYKDGLDAVTVNVTVTCPNCKHELHFVDGHSDIEVTSPFGDGHGKYVDGDYYIEVEYEISGYNLK